MLKRTEEARQQRGRAEWQAFVGYAERFVRQAAACVAAGNPKVGREIRRVKIATIEMSARLFTNRLRCAPGPGVSCRKSIVGAAQFAINRRPIQASSDILNKIGFDECRR